MVSLSRKDVETCIELVQRLQFAVQGDYTNRWRPNLIGSTRSCHGNHLKEHEQSMAYVPSLESLVVEGYANPYPPDRNEKKPESGYADRINVLLQSVS